MSHMTQMTHMNLWLEQVFWADAANSGGVVRRNIDDVERYAKRGSLTGLEALVTEAKARGFHVVEIGSQVVVLCNEGSLTIHC